MDESLGTVRERERVTNLKNGIRKKQKNKLHSNLKLALKTEKNKEALCTYGIILIICLIMCAPLLQFHIASDTYNFMDLGYFEYPLQYFLKDARLVSTICSYIAGFLNLPFEVFVVLMEICAVIFSSISIYLIYSTVKDKLKLSSIWKKVLLIMASFIIVFNCMSLEYLLYAESGVMCLSLTLSILAAKVISEKKKHKYLKSVLLMIIATFCYQGAVNVFLPLAILFIFISTKNLKDIAKQIACACGIILVAYIVNVVSISVINIILGTEQARVGGGILKNLMNFPVIISYIIKNIIIYNYNLWPIAITPIFIAISVIILLFQESAIEKLLKYLVIVIVALGICIAPVFFMKTPSMEPRMAMSVGAIVGISLIYLISLQHKYKTIKYITFIIILGFFVYNAINTNQIYTTHIATNKIDDNMGIAIKYQLEEYERETGNIVTKVAYYRDASHRDYHYGWDKKYSSFAQRAFDNYFCIVEALNYYCDRKFEDVPMTQKVYDENFKGKNWNAYSDEQLVFIEDTMYICTY